MKYDRYLEIYKTMGDILREEFIDRYNLVPGFIKHDRMVEFDHCMKQFILDHQDSLTIKRACEIYTELKDIPHPNLIPESWGLNPYGKELMKDAYIEKLEQEINNLKLQIAEQKNEPVRNSEIKENPDQENLKKVWEKLIDHRVSGNRYKSLSRDEIQWILDNVELSEEYKAFFRECCASDSLKEVARKKRISHSKAKHYSAAIMRAIRNDIYSRRKE